MNEYDYRLIIGYLESSINDEEVQYLLAKVQSDKNFAAAFHAVAEIWSAREKITVDSEKALLALGRLHQRMEEPQAPVVSKLAVHRSLFAFITAAAAILVLCMVFLFNRPLLNLFSGTERLTYIQKTTGAGQKMKIKLPDGSLVILNTLSSIKIPSDYGKENRQIMLNGEAWFEVEKNPERPFIVHAGRIQTLVLGTKFNISGYAEDATAKVSLVEGKVQVDLDKDARKRQILLPGDQLVYSKKDSAAVIRPFVKEYAVGWKDNTLTLDYDSWPEAARKISRWYDVKVEFKDSNLSACKLKGSFTGMPLTEVLKRLSYISGISWEIHHKTVLITGNCN